MAAAGGADAPTRAALSFRDFFGVGGGVLSASRAAMVIFFFFFFGVTGAAAAAADGTSRSGLHAAGRR